MKIVYLSTFMNQHQLPLSLEMSHILGEEYKYIALNELSEGRKQLGQGSFPAMKAGADCVEKIALEEIKVTTNARWRKGLATNRPGEDGSLKLPPGVSEQCLHYFRPGLASSD